MSYLLYNDSFDINTNAVNLNDAIGLAIEKDALKQYYFVVPTGRQVRWNRYQIINKYYQRHNKCATDFNLYTLETLIRYCFNKLFRTEKFHIISDAYRLALFEEAVEKANLKYFRRGSGKMSYNLLQRLSDLVYGLRKDGLTLDELMDETNTARVNNLLSFKGESFQQTQNSSKAQNEIQETEVLIFDILRLNDVANLFWEYEKLLGERYLDEPAIISLVNNALSFKIDDNSLLNEHSQGYNHIFPANSKIIFSGFSEFRLPEIEFLKHFVSQNFVVKNISTGINITYSIQNGPLFGNLSDTIERLINAGYKAKFQDIYNDKAGTKTELQQETSKKLVTNETSDGLETTDSSQKIDTISTIPRASYLRRWLFNTEKELRHKGFSSIISIVEANDRLDEVNSIAKLVRYLNEVKGIELSEICIASRIQKTYTSLFREIFALNSIPVNISDRYELEKSPVVISIFSVIDIMLYNFRRDDVHKALQSPYLMFNNSSETEKIDSALLYETAKKMRIIGGRKYGGAKFWIQRLQYRIEAISKSLKSAEESFARDELEIISQSRYKRDLEKALHSLETLVNLIPVITKKITLIEFKDIIINNIIKRLKIRESIIEHYRRLKNTQDFRTRIENIILVDEIEKDSRALSQFLNILDEMTFILKDREPEMKYDFEELYKKLKTSVIGSKYQIREKSNYGVNITSIEQTRGIPYKVLILCGAVDGEFPLRYRSDMLLGKELKSSEQKHIQSERMQFYQFLTNNEEALDDGKCELYIFYPGTSQGEELVRSPFIDDLLKITTLESDNKIFLLNDLRSQISKHNDNIYKSAEQEQGSLYIPEWVNAITNTSDLLKYLSIEGNYEVDDLNFVSSERINDRFNDFSKSTQDAIHYHKFCLDMQERSSGIIDKSILSEKENKYLDLFLEKPVSVNDLEMYSSCPYKFFVKKIMSIAEPSDEETMLSALEKGNLMHIILFKFYSTLQENSKVNNKNDKLKPVRLIPDKIENYKLVLNKIAKDEIEKIKFVHPFFELDEITLFGRNERKGWLELFLDNEIFRIANGWGFEPVQFEVGFGLTMRKEKSNLLPPIEIDDGLVLRGKIDRVEIYRDEGIIYINICDYKTGSKIASLNEIKEGLSFQMPLYLLATIKIFKEYFDVEAIPAGATYVKLNPKIKDNELESEKVVFIKEHTPISSYLSGRNKARLTEDAIENILNKSIEFAKAIIRKISNGEFPIEPLSQVCNNCNYYPICRIKKM